MPFRFTSLSPTTFPSIQASAAGAMRTHFPEAKTLVPPEAAACMRTPTRSTRRSSRTRQGEPSLCPFCRRGPWGKRGARTSSLEQVAPPGDPGHVRVAPRERRVGIATPAAPTALRPGPRPRAEPTRPEHPRRHRGVNAEAGARHQGAQGRHVLRHRVRCRRAGADDSLERAERRLGFDADWRGVRIRRARRVPLAARRARRHWAGDFVDLHLSDDELAKFHASADVMREHCKLISQYL